MIALLLSAAIATAPTETHVDVPQGKRQEVVVVERVFPVGASSGWHTHPGIEIGRVVSGQTEMRTADGAVRRYAAGETFVIPRGMVHNGVNVGTEPARLVITYLIDKGAPIRAEVPEPHAH